jgi:hypothetical protein
MSSESAEAKPGAVFALLLDGATLVVYGSITLLSRKEFTALIIA